MLAFQASSLGIREMAQWLLVQTALQENQISNSRNDTVHYIVNMLVTPPSGYITSLASA